MIIYGSVLKCSLYTPVLEMENKKFALKKKTISLDLTNEDTIKSKRKKNMEIVKSELKKLDVIQDESPTEAKNPQLVTLGMFFFVCSGVSATLSQSQISHYARTRCIHQLGENCCNGRK